MSFRTRVSRKENSRFEKTAWFFGLSMIAVMLICTGGMSCKKQVEEGVAAEGQAEETAVKTGINEFEGVVKMALGKYLYIPSIQGFDIVAEAAIETGDLTTLEGKEVKVTGEFSPEKPSIMVANSIDIKEGEAWRNVFTRSGSVALDDYLDSRAREEFVLPEGLAYNKADAWEGKGKIKIFGKLETETVTQGESQKVNYKISVLDEKDKEVGKVIVDQASDFALYYIKKLRYFDRFWFYLDVKATVDWGTRRRTRELFHADLVFAGLY